MVTRCLWSSALARRRPGVVSLDRGWDPHGVGRRWPGVSGSSPGRGVDGCESVSCRGVLPRQGARAVGSRVRGWLGHGAGVPLLNSWKQGHRVELLAENYALHDIERMWLPAVAQAEAVEPLRIAFTNGPWQSQDQQFLYPFLGADCKTDCSSFRHPWMERSRRMTVWIPAQRPVVRALGGPARDALGHACAESPPPPHGRAGMDGTGRWAVRAA